MNCFISKRAQAVIETDLGRFPDTETGGLLLGYSESENGLFVLEATDSGYQNTVHTVGSFQYDNAYEEHLCNFLSQLYQPPLTLVGVWHKHNSAHSGNELPFSHADELIHRQLMESHHSCISILFEKTNESGNDIHYNARVFLLSSHGKHRDITNGTVWDDTSLPVSSVF